MDRSGLLGNDPDQGTSSSNQIGPSTLKNDNVSTEETVSIINRWREKIRQTKEKMT